MAFTRDNTLFAHAAFVPLTAGTIVDLERVLRTYDEWEAGVIA